MEIWIETQLEGEPRVFFMEGMCALTRVRWLFAPTLGFSGPAVTFVPFPASVDTGTWPAGLEHRWQWHWHTAALVGSLGPAAVGHAAVDLKPSELLGAAAY